MISGVLKSRVEFKVKGDDNLAGVCGTELYPGLPERRGDTSLSDSFDMRDNC
jgi:hypothetical protein